MCLPSLIGEERLIGSIHTLNDILQSLTPQFVPECIPFRLLQLRIVLLDLCSRSVSPIHFVVSSLKRDGVIPYGGGDVDQFSQIFVPFAVVQFEFVGPHLTVCKL